MNINDLLLDFFKQNKRYVAVYIIFMLAYPISVVFLPKYYGIIVEKIKENKDPQFIVTFLFLIITNVMYGILDQIDLIFIPKMQTYVRTNIVKIILDNYKDKFQEQELGTLISKIIKLPLIIRELLWQFRNHVIPLILILIMVVGRFIIIDRKIGLYATACILAGIPILVSKWKSCMDISSGMDDQVDTVHENISELFDNLFDIYASGTYDKEIENLEKHQEETISNYKRTFSCTNNFRTWLNIISIATFMGTLIYAYQLYKQKKLDLPNMINVAITSMYIISKIGSFSGEIPDMVFNLGIYIRTQKFIQSLDSKSSAIENFHIQKGGISCRNIDISYGDKKVLKNFSIDISPRESVAIVGKVGSGKSSLIKAILKLIPYQGAIYVDNKDITDVDPAMIRSQILFIRQNPTPFNRTLYENIVYGNDSISKEAVDELFKKYDLHKFFNHDLDDSVGRKGDKLSGGQKMVLFLLRAMLKNNKKIIILDEPTSSLDEKTADKIMEIIKDVTKNQTTIIITHDTRLLNMVNRVIKIDS